LEDIERIALQIDNGKQLGSRFSFMKNKKTIWSSVGIQKYNENYMVFIDEIDEHNIIAEIYSREEIKEFISLREALDYIEYSTALTFDKLLPCKGQRIFNPEFNQP